MTVTIYVAIILTYISVAAKMSSFDKRGKIFLCAGLMILAIIMKIHAINFSSKELMILIKSPQVHRLIAIVVTLEFLLLLFSAFSAETPATGRETVLQKIENKAVDILKNIEKYRITLLIIPALYITETHLIYSFPGTNFTITSLIAGTVVTVSCVAFSAFVNHILPSRKMKEEFMLTISLALCVFALYVTNGETLVYKMKHENDSTLIRQLMTLSIFVAGFIIGYIINSNKKHKA